MTGQPPNRREVLKMTPAGLLTAGLFSLTSGCVGRGASGQVDEIWGRWGRGDGRFHIPRAIEIDRNDQVYIVDKTGRIQVFDRDGQWIMGWKTPDTANGKPTGLAIHRGDKEDEDLLLVADTHYYRMLAYSLDGTRIESREIGGTSGTGPGQFAFVTDVATDAAGNFYIGEYSNSDRIQKFDSEGNFVSQFGGTGREPQRFVRPQALMVCDDMLLIADAGNHRIQRYDLRHETPQWIDSWGSEGDQPGQFYYPYGMARASDGTIVVCEYGNNRIQSLDSSGNPIGTWGTAGIKEGQLHNPWSLAIDSEDMVYVLDSSNHRVQRTWVPS